LCAAIERTRRYRILTQQKALLANRVDVLSKELQYHRGFVQTVEKKLSNERFVNNAPDAVVDKERKKLADGQAKVKSLEEALARLGC